MTAALSAAAVILVAAAVLGATDAVESVAAPEAPSIDTDTPDYDDFVGEKAVKSAKPGTPGAPVPAGTVKEPAKKLTKSGERVSEVGATREGIHKDNFEFGIHAPITFDGAPLNLAEDPVTGLKGYVTYVNRQGGINGLKIHMYPIDDRYTTAGGRSAADRLAKEIKPFLIEGTLGIDQIHKVALGAKAAGIPYMAGGGPEAELEDIGMYQIISNYDQYMSIVVEFICKYGPSYVGGTKASDVRLGTTTLNSELILPVEKRFVAELTKRKCVRTPVDPDARGTINKPTEQSTYSGQLLDLRTSYDNQGANLLVPMQDPISTSRQTLEWSGSGYRPKWTIANFAHDGDTALALFQGQWTGMRVMSGACYYSPTGGGKPYDPKLCARMTDAHKQWTSLGQVTYDENAGGSFGGKSSFNYNESSWQADGQGGSTGYQLVYFWHGAMKSAGADPTREKFLAALNAYDSYSNLLTSPITFKGSSNKMVGATHFVLLEGQNNLKYRQVVDITPGLVEHF
jgi:ABC-type branched-subunit amino acid transport system substrate-binding protein